MAAHADPQSRFICSALAIGMRMPTAMSLVTLAAPHPMAPVCLTAPP